MEELHKKLLHWMLVERADGTRPWICFDDGGGGDGGGGDGGGDDGGGDDGDDDDDDGQDGGEPSEPAEPDPEANFDFSPSPSLEPGVTLELSAKGTEPQPEVTAAPTTAVTSETLPDLPGTTPEITLPEITVTGSQPSDKEAQDKEEGPPNAAPSDFGTFNDLASLVETGQPSVFDLPAGSQPPEKSLDELFNDLSKEPSAAPPPEPSPAPSPPGIFENAINAVTAALVGQAQAATPVSQDIIQQDQVYDPFSNLDPNKEQDRVPSGQPGIDFTRPDPSSPTRTEDAAQKPDDPFATQQEAFNTFGIEPGFFASQPVEQAAPPAAIVEAPGMRGELEQAAQPSTREQEQTSTTRTDQPQSLTPTPVSTINVTQTPEQIAAQFGTRAEKAEQDKKDDPFGTPEVFNLEMPSAPQAQFDLNTPNPSAPPVEIAQAPQAQPAQVAQAPQELTPQEREILFNPTPMNPPSPAPPVEVAQAPLGKSDKENPSTREFDPTIFDPKTYEPSVPTAYAPAPGPPPEIPGMPGQPGVPGVPGQPGPTSVAGPPAGVPSGVPGSVAGTNDDMIPVTLPGQRLAMTPDMQRQKAIKARRDAIALAMMQNDPSLTGGGSPGFNDMLGRS